MYYPIIDKLREVMARIDEGGGGSAPLIIEGAIDAETSTVTWTGNINDISNAFDSASPVYFHLSESTGYYLLPIIFGYPGGPFYTAPILFPNNKVMCIALNSNNTAQIIRSPAITGN